MRDSNAHVNYSWHSGQDWEMLARERKRAVIMVGVILVRASLTVALGACAVLVTVPVPALGADVPTTIICSDDQCDSGLWKNARGAADEISYWGMAPGHNCTNYVAWKLSSTGVRRPATGPGDAGEWAANAQADGYLVDHTPSIGAVAHWEAGTEEGGVLGHVAYVEAIEQDGSILISEDFWRADVPGPLTFRTVQVESVSNFIHYLDTTDWLRTVTGSDAGWRTTTTGLDTHPQLLTSFTARGVPTVVAVEDGRVETFATATSGWTSNDTGLSGEITDVTAASTRWGGPFILTVDRGYLVMNSGLRSGWQRMPTGVQTAGEIAAVDTGRMWPDVFVSEAGGLFEVWGDPDGWHVQPTGLQSWGAISAVVNASGRPEVYGVHSGMIQRSWLDQTGWHQAGTGIFVSDGVSVEAVVAGGVVNLVVVVDDRLHRYVADGDGWRLEELATDAGASVTAVDTGGPTPMIVQVG